VVSDYNVGMKVTKGHLSINSKSYSAGLFRLTTYKNKNAEPIFTSMILTDTSFSTFISRKEASLLLKKVRKELVK
jgi:hypothetical protein